MARAATGAAKTLPGLATPHTLSLLPVLLPDCAREMGAALATVAGCMMALLPAEDEAGAAEAQVRSQGERPAGGGGLVWIGGKGGMEGTADGG